MSSTLGLPSGTTRLHVYALRTALRRRAHAAFRLVGRPPDHVLVPGLQNDELGAGSPSGYLGDEEPGTRFGWRQVPLVWRNGRGARVSSCSAWSSPAVRRVRVAAVLVAGQRR